MFDLIASASDVFGIHLTDRQVGRFSLYRTVLMEWNKKMNLTAIETAEGIERKHFLDSMSCVLAWKTREPPRTLIDVGTGAGFPGVVLKILYPDMRMTLVESVGKKTEFCRELVRTLELDGVRIENERAENLLRSGFSGKYDVAVARAVAPLDRLTGYLLPFVAPGGMMVAMKGSRAPDEIRMAGDIWKGFGAADPELIPVTLPGDEFPRFLVVSRKMGVNR